MQFEKLDAVATAEIIRSGALPASFAVEAALERLLRRNPAINAVIDRFDDHARAQVAAGVPMGLLAGVPFLLKDTVEYPGFRHTDGSRWFAERIGRQMPPWIAAMGAQGAIFIGKTNTPEFGLMDSTEPVAHGPTLNPWNATITAGGSSGGAAAAVAAGIAPIAHGTDGGGSIRYPAACCGLFGFKPGRDSALAFAIVSAANAGEPGSEWRRWVREPQSRRLRIAVIDVPTHGGPLAANHRAALDHATALLESLGHTLVRERWPFDGPRQHAAFFGRWAYVTHRYAQALPEEQRANFLDTIEPFTRGLIGQGGKFSATEVETLVQDACALKGAMDEFHLRYDVLLTPISAAHPVPLGHHDPRLDFDVVMERVQQNVAFTYVQNATGQPAMSVPLYWTADGLPVGVQLASGEGQDELLLRLAYELEHAQPWQNRWPPSLE
jgi:amidase